MRTTRTIEEELRTFYEDFNAILSRTYVVRGQDEELAETDALRMLLLLSKRVDPQAINRGLKRQLPKLTY